MIPTTTAAAELMGEDGTKNEDGNNFVFQSGELGLFPVEGCVSDTSQAAGTVEFMVKRVAMAMLKVSVLSGFNFGGDSQDGDEMMTKIDFVVSILY